MLPTISKAELGPRPVAGPYSKYFGGDELAVLIAAFNAVAPKVVVEFGCNDGTTAKLLLEHVRPIEKYIGIDVKRGHRTTLANQQSEVPLIAGYHVAHEPRFVLVQQDTNTIEELEPCDAVFIDGDHSMDGVLHDSALAAKYLRPGGVIAWHDYGNPATDVTEALDYLAANDWPIVHVEGTWLALLRRSQYDEVKK